MLEFSRSPYLCNHLSENIHSWIKVSFPTPPNQIKPYHTTPHPTHPPHPTLPYPTLPYPTLPYPTLPYPILSYPTLPYPTQPYPYPTLTLPPYSYPYTDPTLLQPIQLLPHHTTPYPKFEHMHITKTVAVELCCHATALICILMYFNIAQRLICKTVTRLHRALIWSVMLL